jgi:amino acid permease
MSSENIKHTSNTSKDEKSAALDHSASAKMFGRIDSERQSIQAAPSELKRRLKSRHLQMIAIGTLNIRCHRCSSADSLQVAR